MDEFRRRLMMIQPSEGGDIEIPTTVGVYILGKDNRFHKRTNWANGVQAVGVAIINPKSNFIIAPEVIPEQKRWSAQFSNIEGICNTNKQDVALKDYVGYENTKKILEQDPDSEAAVACKNYHFKNGMTGYLPSLGELNLISKNLQEVNLCLNLIGSQMIGVNMYNDVYWSSTQNGAASAWRMYLTDGYSLAVQKSYLSIILPLAKL